MTEEEKKEFEEFLQWKAEKAKLAEQTGLDKQVEQPEMSKQTDSSVECEADAPQQKDSAQDTTKTSVDVPKENNSGLFIMVAAVVGIFLLFLVLILFRNDDFIVAFKQSPHLRCQITAIYHQAVITAVKLSEPLDIIVLTLVEWIDDGNQLV